MKATIMGLKTPAMDAIVRFNDNPVTRSSFRRELIVIIWEAGPKILIQIVCHTLMKRQKGHVVAKNRINIAGTYNPLPKRYSLFIRLVRSVNQPEGIAKSMFTALLMLRINPISTVVAPKRLMKSSQYCPASSMSLCRKSLPIITLKFQDCLRQNSLKSSPNFNKSRHLQQVEYRDLV